MNNKAMEKSILGTILLEENMKCVDNLSLMPYHFSVKNSRGKAAGHL